VYLSNGIRCRFIIFATRELDYIGERGFLAHGLFLGVFALGDFVEELDADAGNCVHISTSVCNPRIEQTLCRFTDEIGFLFGSGDALIISLEQQGGSYVFIWEIEYGAGMAAIEDRGQSGTLRERFHDDVMNFLKLELFGKRVIRHQQYVQHS
jgi:hypothetical protein